MTFLAPWAMWLGAAGAVGAVLLHLVARARPAAYSLPTARFIPERQALVSRAASRPRDLLLLFLRVLVLLCAGAAFARPVLTGTVHRPARIVLLDESALVADPAAAARRAMDRIPGSVRTVIIGFDTAARVRTPANSARRSPAPAGSITAALVAARRSASVLPPDADSIELVLVSPVGAAEVDAATWPVRALWPGAIRVERVAARDADTAGTGALERAVPLADPLGPSLVRMPVRAGARATRIRRAARATPADSAFARAGGALVLWDSAAAPVRAEGIAAADDVTVAPLGRRGTLPAGAVVARWADGAPAAVEAAVGAGCIRTVGVAVPAAGDVALRPGVQRLVRALVRGCGARDAAPADSAVLRRLAGTGGPAAAAALGDGSAPPSRLVPWLLGIALACALLELLARRRTPEAAP